MEIINLMVEGNSPKEAAAILKLTNESVAESRLRRARYVTDSRTTVHLICKLYRQGIILLLLACSAHAADYPVLTQTNMAPNFQGMIEWRSFIEPELYTTTSTNWSEPHTMLPDTNGLVRTYQVANIVTNRTLRFTFEGKRYDSIVGQERGPMVGMREVPTPVDHPAMQLRSTQLRLRR